MDTLTPDARRRAMQAVRSKDSKIEKALRSALWQKGLRYRKHYSKLPGKPDIVFVKAKVVVFCDSEFWHGHDWDNRKADIKSNQDFWHKKIERNMQRDREVTQRLSDDGWIVLRFWGKAIQRNLDECVRTIQTQLSAKKTSDGSGTH